MQASALPNPWGLDGDELQVGFAKLQGARMEYVIQKHTVSMGRHSKTSNVDLVLGDNMNLSRHHADIAFNFDSGECCPARVGTRVPAAPSTLYVRGAAVLRFGATDGRTQAASSCR
jgi:hypothetical protein